MPSKNQIKKQKTGFTIIEVVLVLAIAGLIFLMVFVALPALQRSQRDTQRREDMARFISQLSQYEANNSGKTPGAGQTTAANIKNEYNKTGGFIDAYLKAGGDSFVDPGGSAYTVEGVTICTSSACAQASVAADTQGGKIRVYTNATCNGEAPKYESGERKIAVTYKLEGAGIYCGHN